MTLKKMKQDQMKKYSQHVLLSGSSQAGAAVHWLLGTLLTCRASIKTTTWANVDQKWCNTLARHYETAMTSSPSSLFQNSLNENTRLVSKHFSICYWSKSDKDSDCFKLLKCSTNKMKDNSDKQGSSTDEEKIQAARSPTLDFPYASRNCLKQNKPLSATAGQMKFSKAPKEYGKFGSWKLHRGLLRAIKCFAAEVLQVFCMCMIQLYDTVGSQNFKFGKCLALWETFVA